MAQEKSSSQIQTQGKDELIRGIAERSESDIKAILEQAKQDAEKTLRDAGAEAEKFQTEILRRAATQAEAVRRRILSGVHLEVKKQNLQVMEETLSKIFQQVKDRLEAFRKDKEYAAFLDRLILEGVEALDSPDIRLIPGSAERSLLSKEKLAALEREAEKLKRKVHLLLSDQTLAEGGVVLESADGRTRFDNTFSARIRRFESAMRMAAMKMVS